MAIPSKAAVTGGVTEAGWYPDLSKRFVVRERVTNGTSNVTFLKLTQQLPPQTRVLYAETMWSAALTLGAGSSVGTNGTATRVSLVRFTSDAAMQTSMVTNVAHSNFAIFTSGTTTASNTISRSFVPNPVTQALTSYETTSTVNENVYILPASTGTQTYNIDSTAATSTSATSYVFSGANSIDVLLYCEAFGDLQTA